MFPSLGPLLNVAGITAVFGAAHIRIYPHGEAPATVAKPYAVYQMISGTPENYLATRSDMDAYRLQFDVYATTGTAATNGASVIRVALEGSGYVLGLNGVSRDADTNLIRYSFDMEFHNSR